MAKTTIYTCDRCGVEIAEDKSGIQVMGGNPPRHLVARRVDFCEGCAAAFVAWCDEGKPKAEEEG